MAVEVFPLLFASPTTSSLIVEYYRRIGDTHLALEYGDKYLNKTRILQQYLVGHPATSLRLNHAISLQPETFSIN